MDLENKNVLIVEDDDKILQLLKIHLEDLGFICYTAVRGVEAIKLFQNYKFDLVLLDLMLPDLDGIEICKMIRAQNQQVAIIMLTAKSEEIDKIVGLELGADDYMTKPFSVRELQSRIKAVIRRTGSNDQFQINEKQLLEYGELVLDLDKKRVTLRNERIDLSKKEFQLISLLASKPGKSFTRKQLLNTIWGYDFEGFDHTVNSHINRLRAKIETDMSQPKYILTTWGLGYRFNEDI